MKVKCLLLGLGLTAAVVTADTATAQAPQGLDKLSHILVVYLENRSFDNVLGEFPRANGITNVGEAALQRDREGHVYSVLPAVEGPFRVPHNPEPVASIPTLDDLPNRPFKIEGIRPDVTVATYTRDLIHAFYTNRSQIHHGRNDWFALFSNAHGLVMGYYGAEAMKETNLWKLAEANTLLDNFFQGAFGGSFANHFWLICGCAPNWPNPPADQRSQLDSEGYVVKEARVVAPGDGDFAVNTTQSVFLNDGNQGANLLPAQTLVTIGDRLTDKGVDWAWYSGGWDLATKATRSPEEDAALKQQEFQWHHHPFAYFARFDPTTANGRAERAAHLKDATALEADIKSGSLPPVAFYKPVGVLNQHPGYANLTRGDEEMGRIVRLMDESPMKDSYAIIITYDEFGGFYDHVPPPQPDTAGKRADFFGPGPRVPTLVVSPLARKGAVDHTEYDTTSILKLISERYRLEPLPSPRLSAVESLSKAFDFTGNR